MYYLPTEIKTERWGQSVKLMSTTRSNPLLFYSYLSADRTVSVCINPMRFAGLTLTEGLVFVVIRLITT